MYILQALLHAISKGLLNIVRIIVDHPKYISGEKKKKDVSAASARTEEKHQYSPDITPLMLAAHRSARLTVSLQRSVADLRQDSWSPDPLLCQYY